jgi:P-type conjugative transfer protein TrbJ
MRTKSLALPGLVAAVLLLAPPAPARAGGIPVFDGVNLAQGIQQTAHQVTQIAHMVAQIRNQTEMLRLLANSEWGTLGTMLAGQDADLNAIMSATSALSYSVGALQGEVNALYPTGAGWQKMDFATLDAKRAQWDTAMWQANLTAMQAQSMVSRMQARNAAIEALLAQSQTSGGQVRQQQINNQLLGSLASGFQDLGLSMATTHRALIAEQARQLAERELGQEQNRRLMEGFTDPGEPVSVSTTLPRIQ